MGGQPGHMTGPVLAPRAGMRIIHSFLIVAFVALGANFTVAGQPKYGVTVQTVQPAGLAKAKTYVWTVTRPSPDKSIDAMIVAAVDRELGARGLTKVPSGQSDMTVTYNALSRTDVDLKSKPSATGALSEFTVGTLIVDITNTANRQVLYRVRTDTPIERDRTTLTAAIDAAVAALFEKYPTTTKR